MPILEFHCPACDKVFEELVRSADKTGAVACPTCGNGKVDRQVSVFAARSGNATDKSPLPAGACGRCGDPNGPCSM